MRKLGILFALFCVGTVLSCVGMFFYWQSSGILSGERLGKLFALLRGEEIAAPANPTNTATAEKTNQEPPSLEESEQARSLATRGVEMRSLSVASYSELLKSIRDEIERKEKAHKEAVDKFVNTLHEKQGDARDKGRAVIQSLMEKLPAKKAKEQLMLMVDADDRDDAVAIFNTMEPTKQAKIVSEFKTDGEIKVLADILRDIRKGNPVAPFVGKTLDENTKPDNN